MQDQEVRDRRDPGAAFQDRDPEQGVQEGGRGTGPRDREAGETASRAIGVAGI